jgi:hypothetical protein
VKISNKLIGDLVMSRGSCIVQVSNDLADFSKGNRGIAGRGAIGLFHKVG